MFLRVYVGVLRFGRMSAEISEPNKIIAEVNSNAKEIRVDETCNSNQSFSFFREIDCFMSEIWNWPFVNKVQSHF